MARDGQRTPAATPRGSDTLDRGAVIAEAVALVEQDGLEGFTLTAVANRLSVTQPALYRHVSSVDEVWSGVALHARQQLLAALTQAAVGRSRDEAIAAVAAAWRTFAAQHASLYRSTDLVALAGDPGNEEAAQDIVALLTQVVASYGLDATEAEQAAWAVRSALHGFAVLETERGNPTSLDLDVTHHRLVALLQAGLRTWHRSRRG